VKPQLIFSLAFLIAWHISAQDLTTNANLAVLPPDFSKMIVQTTLDLTNAALAAQVGSMILWSGGEAVAGNPLQRKVSKSTSAKTTVTATLGSTSQSINVWVVWADLTIKVSGTLDADDKAAVLNNGNFPRQNTTYGSIDLGGGNSLGPIDRFSNTNLNYGYAIGKMEAKAVLQPSGIGNLLTGTNIWNLKRTAVAIAWDNSGSPTYTTGGSNPPSGQDDTGGDYFKYLNTTNGDTFDLDWPACPILSSQIPNHTSEVYDNFYEYVTINLGSGDQLCSTTNTYSYTAQIDFDATTNKVQLNSLSASLITLPTTPHYTQR